MFSLSYSIVYLFYFMFTSCFLRKFSGLGCAIEANQRPGLVPLRSFAAGEALYWQSSFTTSAKPQGVAKPNRNHQNHQNIHEIHTKHPSVPIKFLMKHMLYTCCVALNLKNSLQRFAKSTEKLISRLQGIGTRDCYPHSLVNMRRRRHSFHGARGHPHQHQAAAKNGQPRQCQHATATKAFVSFSSPKTIDPSSSKLRKETRIRDQRKQKAS